MLIRFEGLVLRKKDYGESHQIITVFTEPYGRFSFVARGSKKTRSRFSAVTEPFTLAQFICFQGNKGSMPTLSQADLIHGHIEIRNDLLLTAYGAYWFELLLKTTVEKEARPNSFHLLVQALGLLEERKNPDVLTRIVELRLMETAGYRPLLTQCVHCHETHRPVRFSVRQGGVLCMKCEEIDPQAKLIGDKTHHILMLLQKIQLNRLGEVQIRAEIQQEMEQSLRQFIDYYLESQFPSRDILRQLRS